MCQVSDDPGEWAGEWNGGDGPHERESERVSSQVGEVFWDGVTGKKLDAIKVRQAREEELKFVEGKPLYEVVPVEEAWKETGKAPISTKWIDTDKGEEYRSRWVARDFKDSKTDEYFAATPPWEMIKLLVSLAASQKGSKGKGE